MKFKSNSDKLSQSDVLAESRPMELVQEHRDLRIVSKVEPFLDIDVARRRAAMVDASVVNAFERSIAEALGDHGSADFLTNLTRVLAEIRADIHYLKAAYLDSERDSQPAFEMSMPPVHEKQAAPALVEIDFRSDITGGNWHQPEPDGRWAGPESESSLLLPALDPGSYRVEFDVISEIVPGILAETELLVNNEVVALARQSEGLPTVVTAAFEVSERYRLPFWSIKLRFPKVVSPSELGLPDDRRLAIHVRSLRIVRCAA